MYVETLTEDKLDQFMERKDVLILSVFEIEESKWFEMAVSKTLSR